MRGYKFRRGELLKLFNIQTKLKILLLQFSLFTVYYVLNCVKISGLLFNHKNFWELLNFWGINKKEALFRKKWYIYIIYNKVRLL